MIETRDYQDCMSLIPWGPVSLWGPTETRVLNLEQGFRPEAADVRYLLTQLNNHLATPLAPSDIISIRCGVRPLAVDYSFPDSTNTLNLSRRQRIYADRQRPWMSIYGGKLTSCLQLARVVRRQIAGYANCGRPPRVNSRIDSKLASVANRLFGTHKQESRNYDFAAAFTSSAELDTFPGLRDPVASARWSSMHEMCWSLEDYLRRRTNIAQWIPRGGLGAHDEHLTHLHALAQAFHTDERHSRSAVSDYKQKIKTEFDELLAQCH